MSNETEPSPESHKAMPIGKIPERRPDRLWGGRGNGKDTCQICGKPLNQEDVTLDLEYRGEGGNADLVCYCVHLHCFNAQPGERELTTPRRTKLSAE